MPDQKQREGIHMLPVPDEVPEHIKWLASEIFIKLINELNEQNPSLVIPAFVGIVSTMCYMCEDMEDAKAILEAIKHSVHEAIVMWRMSQECGGTA